ncbi:MAG: alpha-L-fucosidase, partial [Verrucomicrobia bacterium]|nr:alpha-L-fucosidase [Verrucomicrobiota bacterium]
MRTPVLKPLILATLLLDCLTLAQRAAEIESTATAPKPYPERVQWWGEGRFGMFIHWGHVSLKGTEISWSRANSNPKCPNNGPIPAAEYDHLYQRFNPTNFNAREWVELAQAAGMRHIMITAKHHEGFAMFNSAASPFNIVAATPFKRDP